MAFVDVLVQPMFGTILPTSLVLVFGIFKFYSFLRKDR
jgi:hypothetical protein